jgi:hypothetical protein
MIAKSVIGAAVGVFKGLSVLIAACAVGAASAPANASPYLVNIVQVGPDVVATGNGSIDTAGLVIFVQNTSSGRAVAPTAASFFSGSSCQFCGGYDLYRGLMVGPTSFGPGGLTNAITSVGDDVGIAGSASFIGVPFNYVSGAVLSSSAVFAGASFASLGITPGDYLWSWGNSVNQTFSIDIASTPLPAALPLFATGLGLIGLLARRRKRKAAAALAAA